MKEDEDDILVGKKHQLKHRELFLSRSVSHPHHHPPHYPHPHHCFVLLFI